jgi:hypothetical protein
MLLRTIAPERGFAALTWSMALATTLGACGGSPPGDASSREFPGAALSTITSEQGALTIDVRTSPDQPLQRGVERVLLTVKDSSGAFLDGLVVEAIPFMPAMGHGASRAPTVTAQGEGAYLIENVDMFMPGLWELRSSFSGAATDRATPVFDVR